MTQKIQFIIIISLILVGIVAGVFVLNAPRAFPEGVRFTVGEGESLHSISTRLEEEEIIISSLVFRSWISMLGRDTDIDLGVYEFDTMLPLGLVVAKFVKGPDEPLLSVTIPEGNTTQQVADAFKKALPTLSVDVFGELVQKDELDGYLFPSTYYPLPSFREADIIELMKATFEREYDKHFKDSSYPVTVPTQRDVVSLAAILEGEAKGEEDMKIVSGILQKRLAIGMRLQVDVAEVTYRESGIPDHPINNPGVVAINAVFHPIETKYLYYLTQPDGTMHYAKTYEEHKKNIQIYLR